MKKKIIEALKKVVEAEIKQLTQISATAHANATSPELKQESKYDTQGIEAGYLAGAHAQRLAGLHHDFNFLQNFSPLTSVQIAMGSLVEVVIQNQKEIIFICQVVGPGLLEMESTKIRVLSPRSALGKELIGLEVGDSIDFKTPKGTQSYDITAVF